MQNRFSLLFLVVFFLQISSLLRAQTILLDVLPDCGNCNGAIYVSITGNTVPPYVFLWSNGSTSQNLTGLCAGVYTVTVTGQAGTYTSQSAIVQQGGGYYSITSSNTNLCNLDSTITQPPLSTCEKVCPGTMVVYSAVGINGSPSGNLPIGWAVTGATFWTVLPSGNGVSVTWGNPGTGNVSFFVDANCQGGASRCVTIVDAPEAKFTTSPAPSPADVSICKGQTVYFTNESTAASYFEWDFGDNSGLSTAESPQHKYLLPGNYTVRLIALSNCFCVDTSYIKVIVLDAASLELDCTGTICAGTEVTYNATGNCSQFIWTVSPNGTVTSGGGANDASVTVLWTSGSDGVISLLPQSCAQFACPEPSVFHIPVIDDSAEIEGEDRVCPETEERYTIEAFGGANFVWSLSSGGTIEDGQGTNHVTIKWKSNVSTTTIYYLSVKYDNCYLGCGGQDTLPVKILPPYIISGPVERCDGAIGVFNSTRVPGAALNTNWTLIAPDGSTAWTSPSAVATANINFLNGPGFYRIFSTPFDPTQTCSDKAEWAVTVAEKPTKPTGIIGPAEICPGKTVTYSEAGGPHHYRISWSVTNGPGAPSTPTGSPLNITWSNAPAGPYLLALQHISTDGNSCPSDTIQFNVKPIGPFAIAGQTNLCEGTIGTYISPVYENIDVIWTVSPAGTGIIKSGQTISIAEIYWSKPGNHTVTATVCGQSATFPVTIYGNPSPIVVLPASGVCPGNTLNVQTTFPYTGFKWKTAVAGPIISTSPMASLSNGSFVVEVSDIHGCKGTEEFSIDDYPEPNVTLSTLDPTGFCANSYTVTLRALIEGDGLFTYAWYKDGVPLGFTANTYATNQYGKYSVVVTNGYGCTKLSNEILLIEDCSGLGGGGCPGGNCQACPPNAFDINVVPTARCDSFEFHLIPNTPLYLPGGSTWYFGLSGGALLGQEQGNDNPTFVFPNSGQYIAGVRAKLTDGTTCFLYDSAVVAVRAQFDPVPVCPGAALQLEDETTFVPTRSIAGWTWDFGDPASGAANNAAIAEPTHAFATGGIYHVALTVTASTGCTSSVTVPLDIPNAPSPVFSPVNAPCPNNATELALDPDPNIVSVQWNLGDPGSGTANIASGSVVYHNYAAIGNYNIMATATSTFGCTKTAGIVVNIAANPLAGTINPATPGALCEGQTRILSAPTNNVGSYLWSTGEQIPVITIGTEGVYRVTLTALNGCTFVPPAVVQDVKPAPDAIIKALLMNSYGQVYGTEYPSLTTCVGEDVFLEIFGGGTYGYSWSGGNGMGATQEFSEDRGNLLNAGTFNYTVTITDFSSGCTDVSDPFTVQVNPRPALFGITTSGTLCDGNNSVLSYSGPAVPASTQYAWSTGESTSGITVNQGGGYSLVLVNQFGCERKSDPAEIHPGPNVSALPSGCLTRCKPDTLCIGNLFGIASWQWYYNGNPIPGATTADLVAAQDGSYHAVLTDWYGCVKESDPLTLTLQDGFGTVNGFVWSDVNDNGIVDTADTLLSGVEVNLLYNSTPIENATANGGSVTFLNQPSGTYYEIEVDPASLPAAAWEVVIGNAGVALSGCGDDKKGDLLVHLNCILPNVVKLSACAGKSVQYHGTTIPAGGSQVIQFNAGSCDSLLTVNVATIPNTFGSLATQVCQGGVFNYQGVNIAPGQSQQFLLVNAAGCDSTVTVNVSALSVSTGTVITQVCPGDVFIYQGVSVAPGQSKQFILQNYLGCDSVVTVSVTALSTSASLLTQKICPEDVFVYQGTSLSPGQTQQFILQNYQGCDSVVTVSVSAYAAAGSTIARQICANDVFVFQGVSLSPGQTQQFILQSYLGCDSVITVSVSAFAPVSKVLNKKVCAEDVFVYQGISLPPGQSQQFILQSYQGCDSVVTVNVAAYVVAAGTVTAKVCQNDVFTYQGVLISPGQSQQFVLQNNLGCDSTVTVTVVSLPVYALQNTVPICPGTTYTFNGAILKPGETRAFHYSTREVCDSTITIAVVAFPDMQFDAQALQSCPNINDGAVSVGNISGGTAPFEWSLDGTTFQTTPDWDDLAPGDYTVTAQDNNDCLFKDPITVNAALPLDVLLPEALLPCDSTAVLLAPAVGGNTVGGVSFLWHNGSTQPQLMGTTTGPVWVEVTNQCETVHRESRINWADAGKWDQVYIPNVFSEQQPNELNSEFRPFFVAGIEVLNYHFEIFDRWGNLVFTSDNPDESWRGPMVDRMMQGAVFAWQLKADVAFCGRKMTILHAGDVTLLR